MSKEYVDRSNKPLVNPGVTQGEYEAKKLINSIRAVASSLDVQDFDDLCAAEDAYQKAYFAKVVERSAK